jgi:hypothetical protein
MKRINNEKTRMERAAIDLFIDIYNTNHELKYRLLYAQEKPDAVLQDSKQNKLGMEITHLFYDEKEAKMLLGRSEPSFNGPQRLECLVDELNDLIRTKEKKKRAYSEDYPISLLIRNASPFFGMSDILSVKHLLYRPNAVFNDVWFLSRDGTSDWLLINMDIH